MERENDQRKACYADALAQHKHTQKKYGEKVAHLGPPNYEAFGLTEAEAKEIEENGYDGYVIPDHLRFLPKPDWAK